MPEVIPADMIENRILLVRGQKVMLSTDLAELYEVEVKVMMQTVKRNLDRFPPDFMFQLTWAEVEALRSHFVALDPDPGRQDRSIRSQIVTLKRGSHKKYPPYAFTEQGVAMLSSVLRSRRAVQVNIAIMRAFVKLRGILAAHKDLADKLDEMEKRYDAQFKVVFDALRALMAPAESQPKERIGFKGELGEAVISTNGRRS
ncbi:MAG: ORF6N domain-containing protein [Candidatus Zixiibacteriota bacterium]|nr:MAG: ORF6N domain-containing protein [candidate division Zixibacteria bacterium]